MDYVSIPQSIVNSAKARLAYDLITTIDPLHFDLKDNQPYFLKDAAERLMRERSLSWKRPRSSERGLVQNLRN
jgi:hypothetical protein